MSNSCDKRQLCTLVLFYIGKSSTPFEEGARAPATGRGWPGPAGTVKINGKVLMAGAQLLMAGAGRGWQNKRKSSGNAPASSPGHWPGCGHLLFLVW